ncbi:hypothetical protein LVJ94_51440 [Pendulispora rubella]|uniref:Insecticide toxin TcdB middle/N-terminal domain-containing protein n=1 Tax=Pendulispora rubella TaxID=2741070 RepID=A0ABZ2L3F9_9BACT
MVSFFRPRRLSGALTIYLVLLLIPLAPIIASAQEASGATASPASEAPASSSGNAPPAANAPTSDPPGAQASAAAAAAEPSGSIGSGSAASATLDTGEGSGIGNVGRAGVESSTGVAHASVPFLLPKARGEVQPQLGLYYSSTGGAGIGGLGWSMSIPSIVRRNLSGGPKYNDPSGANLPNIDSDRFEFAGRPLVPICRVTGQNTCDAGGSNAVLQPGEQFPNRVLGWLYYRQQVDDFLRFFWSPARDMWLVQGKGFELVLGGTTDSLDFDTIANPSNPPIFRWNITQQRDSNGDANVIVYDWKKFADPEGWVTDGLAYLTDIYDTPRVGGANPSRDSFAHHTHLSYRSTRARRDGHPFTGQVIWRRPLRFLLDRVDVMSTDFLGTAPRSLVRRYGPYYDQRLTDFHRWLLGGVLMYGACPALQEQPGGEVPKDYPTACNPGLAQPVAYFDYWGENVPEKPEIGNLYIGQDYVNKPTIFLDIDGDSLAEELAYKPDGSLVVGRRMGDRAGAPPPLPMQIYPSDISPSELIFNSAMLGGWKSTGSVNALSLKYDNVAHCGDPLFRRYYAELSSGVWRWHSGDPLDQRLYNWMDGWDCSGFHGDPPAGSFVDLDGDGYLDRVSLANIRGPSGSGKYGNTRAIYLTRVDNDTRKVLPFDVYKRATNPDGSPFREIYETFVPSGYAPADTVVDDVNGDSIADIIQIFEIDPGGRRFLYKWIGLGDGTFVDGGQGGPLPKTYVHDVNGDQIPDTLRITRTPGTDVKHFLDITFGDVDGPGETRQIELSTAIPNVDTSAALQFADLNGSGVDSIIVVGGGVHAISLTGTWYPPVGGPPVIQKPRPGLLKSISNGAGATTSFQYRTVESILRNSEYRLPQPLHVVSRVTTSSSADVKATGGPYATDYQYSKPVYRNDERRFLGFREVRAVQSEPNLAQTWSTFLLGDCGENNTSRWCDPPASQLADNPIEALNGRPVVVEASEPTPGLPSVIHHRYHLTQLYKGLDHRTVRTAYVERTDRWYDDEGGIGSAARQVLVSDIVSSDLTSPAPARTIGVRQSPTGQRVHLAAEAVFDGFGNLLSKTDYGMVEAGSENPQDEPISQRFNDWQLPPGDASRWNWHPRDTNTGGPNVTDRHSHFVYDAAGHVTKTYAWLHDTLPLTRFHEDPSKDVALPPNDASQDNLSMLLSQAEYDQFGNVVIARGPSARCSTSTYDDAFHQFPIAVTAYTNGCSGTALTTKAEFDRGLEVTTKTTSPSGEVTRTEYDAYGRPTKIFAPSPTVLGQTEIEPSAKMTYWDPWLTFPPQSAAIVRTETRDDNNLGAAHYRSTWGYVDPYGQPIASVRQADPGDGAPFIVSGEVERDELGRVVKNYEPRFAAFDPNALKPPVPLPSAPATTAVYVTRFVGQATVLSYARDGRLVSKLEPTALVTKTYDAADLAEGATPHPTRTVHDGHGRTVLTERVTNSAGVADTISTRMTYLRTGEVASVKRSHSSGSDSYTRVMKYDSFGRLVENLEPNTSTAFGTSNAKGWRYAYNDAGDLVGTSDARGCGKNSRYDSAGRLLEEVYSPCLNSQPVLTDAPTTKIVYDAPEQGQDNGPGAQAFIGRVAAVYDRAQHTQYVYDARGHERKVRRQIAAPNDEHDVVTAYAPHWFEREALYDAANRVFIDTTGADVEKLLGIQINRGTLSSRSAITTYYSPRGIANVVTSSYGPLVRDVRAEADGRETLRFYGDTHGTTATYEYNERALLRRVRVARTRVRPFMLQDTRFDGYDAVNNPTLIGDWRDPAEWPEGAKPVSRSLTYDDLNQLRKVDYAFATSSGNDKQVSPFEPEIASGDHTPVPEQKLENRVKQQTFNYDWQGNLVNSDDDAHAFFDRSMGSAMHGTASNGPNRVSSAKLGEGKLDASYDAAGNLARMLVTKKGPAGDNINLLFVYEWDEIGNLVRARRLSSADMPNLDALGEDALHVDLSSVSDGVDLRYTYQYGGQRIVKSGMSRRSPNRTYTAEIFSSLRLNHAKFENGDYERNDETEAVYLNSNGRSFARVVYDPELPKGENESALHVFLTITDPLGSTSVVVDHATSELVERVTYLAFGQADSDYRPVQWKSFREDHRFTGKEDDVGVGLTYFGARYYVAALGQWASADPLTVHNLGADLNPYAFVSGSPQLRVDPNGLKEDDYVCNECQVSGGAGNGFAAFLEGMGPGGPTGYGLPAGARSLMNPTTAVDAARARLLGQLGLPPVISIPFGGIFKPTTMSNAGKTESCASTNMSCAGEPAIVSRGKLDTFLIWAMDSNDPRLSKRALDELADHLLSTGEFLEKAAYIGGVIIASYGTAEVIYATVQLAQLELAGTGLTMAALETGGGAAVAGRAAAASAETEATLMDTSAIRFTQSSVKGTFSDGRTLQSTIDALSGAEGDAIASQIPPIRVFPQNGQLFTLDNRRLLAFAAAGRQVPVISATPAEVAAQGWKFTATPEQAGGWFIRVKP